MAQRAPLFVCLVIVSWSGSGLLAAQPATAEPSATTSKTRVEEVIPWLLDEDRQLRGVAFPDLIVAVTGKKVLPFNPGDEVDQRVLKAIGAACDGALTRLNAPGSAIQKIDRINELSSRFEDTLRELLNSASGLKCDLPPTAQGRVQRSGYPDLRIVDLASQRVFYLDAKLYAAGSRESSFRTFYFEPKIATNKVRDDAVHFIAGFEHEPRDKANGLWRFSRWDVVDLAQLKVRLKAEFQASNHDIYRPDAIVASSAK